METSKNNSRSVSKVLVLLAYCNGKKYINKQVQSILAQKNVHVHTIILDDCSDKLSKNALMQFRNNPKISILHSDRASGSAGQNFLKLIRKSNFTDYDFIAFSDQDDIWDKNKLTNAIKLIAKNNADAYSCSVTAFWEDGKTKLISQSSEISDIDYLLEGAGQGCTFVMTSNFFEIVQRFCNENISLTKDFYYHDWLVYVIARSMKFKWFFDKSSNMLYRQHGSNDTGAKTSISSIINRLKLIQNGWYKNQIILAIDISDRAHTSETKITTNFKELFNSKKSFQRRVLLTILFLKNSRRKLTDRIVLVISALLGWI
jgi:rhamnosyltransferase